MDAKPWAGRTIVVIASGPSLTPQDCDLIQKTGLTTIAVNSSWKIARFADVLYAGDTCWWDNYGKEVDIDAQRWTCMRQASDRYRINLHSASGPYNSGMRAIQFALQRGASKVILIGFDCSLKNGLHWHGPHDKTKNPDAPKVRRWHEQFKSIQLLADRMGYEVINCSRYTELKCFPTGDLEIVLAESVDRDLAMAGEPALSTRACECSGIDVSQESFTAAPVHLHNGHAG